MPGHLGGYTFLILEVELRNQGEDEKNYRTVDADRLVGDRKRIRCGGSTGTQFVLILAEEGQRLDR